MADANKTFDVGLKVTTDILSQMKQSGSQIKNGRPTH
jgi:hypothetical protein